MHTINDNAIGIEQKLSQLTNLPAPVRRWNVDIGEDASGLMAAWVWATLDDASLTRAIRNELRERIDSEVRRIDSNLDCIYVRFRAVSEG